MLLTRAALLILAKKSPVCQSDGGALGLAYGSVAGEIRKVRKISAHICITTMMNTHHHASRLTITFSLVINSCVVQTVDDRFKDSNYRIELSLILP